MSEVKILEGNVLETIQQIESCSVRTCVTSPPYFGLRDYGTAEWIGGDSKCEHTVSHWNDNMKPYVNRPVRDGEKRKFCQLCGAVRIDDQIGLEATPELYVDKMVKLFREVNRILADDGTLWLNLGDCYANSQQVGGINSKSGIGKAQPHNNHKKHTPGLKPKDLVGIPWAVAFALRADGWYLRQDIIWHKRNPMPESVTDRPTTAHEHIFLFSKSQQYYYDYEAIMEDVVTYENRQFAVVRDREMEYNSKGNKMRPRKKRGEFNGKSEVMPGREAFRAVREKRNKRSVWSVTTKPYKGAHFAVFPPKLIEPCILAGSAKGDTVFDPFGGSGTTAAVALQHGRDAILCELNSDYIPLINKRLSKVQYQML